MKYDIAIIGAGPAGYTAAIKAAKKGYKAVLIEREELGGTCLNWGCIPTKTYYRHASFLRDLASSEKFGVRIDQYSFSLDETFQRKEEVIGRLKEGVSYLIKKSQVEYLKGEASFITKNKLLISGATNQEIEADYILIATGSKTKEIPVKGADHPSILDNKSILELKEVPDTLLIIGGGVVGTEFAGIFNYFGSQVHIVEYMPEILLSEDREVVKRFMPLFKKQGVKISVSSQVTEIKKTEKGFEVTIKDKKDKIETVEVSHVLNAAGRMANTDGLNLENAGLSVKNNKLVVNQKFQTEVPSIFAVGDVNGIIMLAHAATHQAGKAIEHISDPQKKSSPDIIPAATFTFPEISSVGVTEEQAKEQGIAYKKNKVLFMANGKALAMGEKDGFVKVLTDEDDRLIGAHIIGPHASDLIHEAVIAISKKMKADDFVEIVHAHPTLSETFDEAVLGIPENEIHQKS